MPTGTDWHLLAILAVRRYRINGRVFPMYTPPELMSASFTRLERGFASLMGKRGEQGTTIAMQIRQKHMFA